MKALRSLAEVTAEVVADMRMRQRVLKVITLGVRPNVELITALVRLHPNPSEAEAVVEAFASIDPLHLAVTGGDRPRPSIVRSVAP